MANLPDIIRWSLFRNLYATLTGVDIGNIPTSGIDLLPFARAGIIPTVVINDSTYPLTVSFPAANPFVIGSSAQTILRKGSGQGGTAIATGSDTTLYTPTAGKTGYITTIAAYTSASTYIAWEDGPTGASSFTTYQNLTGEVVITFPVPFKVATALKVQPAGNTTLFWGIVYFEQ